MISELKAKAHIGDFESSIELARIIRKLQDLFLYRWNRMRVVNSFEDVCVYFEKLGCEVKSGSMSFEGGDFICVSLSDRTLRKWHKVHINVPFEIVDKALVIGLP